MQHRTIRYWDSFDSRLDAEISSFLTSEGFRETTPYRFSRGDEKGEDVIYFETYSDRFLVRASYRPLYMDEVERLIEMPLGFADLGAFRYMTPVCFVDSPRSYSTRPAAARDGSIAKVLCGLKEHGLRSLSDLRIPGCYADWVSINSTLFFARAQECAGRLQRAKEAYEDVLQRSLKCWDLLPPASFAKFEGAREFVYASQKLGKEHEKCAWVMNALKFFPETSPIQKNEG